MKPDGEIQPQQNKIQARLAQTLILSLLILHQHSPMSPHIDPILHLHRPYLAPELTNLAAVLSDIDAISSPLLRRSREKARAQGNLATVSGDGAALSRDLAAKSGDLAAMSGDISDFEPILRQFARSLRHFGPLDFTSWGRAALHRPERRPSPPPPRGSRRGRGHRLGVLVHLVLEDGALRRERQGVGVAGALPGNRRGRPRRPRWPAGPRARTSGLSWRSLSRKPATTLPRPRPWARGSPASSR